VDFPGEKLVIKLWETVAEKGIGGLFKPWQMRREGRATIQLKQEELLAIAQAERDADRIRRGEVVLETCKVPYLLAQTEPAPESATGDTLDNLRPVQYANSFLISETVRHEANVTRALLHAETSLEDDPQTPSESSVSDDWLFRWRDSASQVSAEELQYLWGRLLAGEIKSPGSYSLRTLEFLRNLSQREAEAIAKLSQFVVDTVIFRDASELLEKSGVTYGFLMNMQQLGILAGVEAIGLSITWNSLTEDRFTRALISNSMVLVVTADDPRITIALPAYQLTEIGQQVLRLGKFGSNIEYLKKVGEHLKSQGAKVDLAQYDNISPGKIQYYNGQTL
jgi:hypothetical protein